MITWACSDGRELGGERVVPAASTIKLFVASAFWRSDLDPDERVEVAATPWSLADRLAGPVTLADCALLMLAFSDNAATNVLLELLGFDAVNREAERLGATQTEVRRPMMGEGLRTSRRRWIWREVSPRSLSRGSSTLSQSPTIRSCRTVSPTTRYS